MNAVLEKKTGSGPDDFVEVASKEFLPSANNYSVTVRHNFGKRSPATYRIIYYWVATSGDKKKDEVMFEVVTP